VKISTLTTCFAKKSPYLCRTIQHNETCSEAQARVAQLVERDLAKVEVASSNLVSRSKTKNAVFGQRFLFNPKPIQGFGLILTNASNAGVVEWYTRGT
jgi:hypothetical protein